MKRLFLLFVFFIASSSFAQYDQSLNGYDRDPIIRNDEYQALLVSNFIDSSYIGTYRSYDANIMSVPKHLFKINTNQVINLQDTVDTYGYLKIESDPSVPSWSKQPAKPTYNVSEITGYTAPINYTSGTGIDISSGVISTTAKRQETYSGTTNASGQYTVVFSNSYSVAPNIQANIIGGSDTQNIRITSIGTTGFTVTVRNRTDVVGLLPTWSNVNGASVDVLITQK